MNFVLKFTIVVILWFASSSASATVTVEKSEQQALLIAADLAAGGRVNEANIIWKSLAQNSRDFLIVLEAGRGQLNSKLPRDALETFKIARNLKLPASVFNRLSYFEEIARRQIGLWTYSWSLSKEKNPMNYPKSGTYELLGMPLRYENKYEGSYFSLNQSLNYQRDITADTSFQFSLNSTDVEDGFADKHSTNVQINKFLEGQNLRISPSLSRLDEPGMVETHLALSVTDFSFDPITTSLSATQLMRKDDHQFDGYETLAIASVRHDFGLFDISPTLKLGETSLRSKSHSHQLKSIGFAALADHSKIQFSSSVEVIKKSFNAPDIFWGRKRREQIVAFGISLCPGAENKRGLRACLEFNRTKGNANIDFFDVEKMGVTLRLMAQ